MDFVNNYFDEPVSDAAKSEIVMRQGGAGIAGGVASAAGTLAEEGGVSAAGAASVAGSVAGGAVVGGIACGAVAGGVMANSPAINSTSDTQIKSLKKPELLSPAGNLLKLKIAIAYGADAVYASLGSFSLRQRSAKEFDPQTFSEGVKYAHENGVKFYAATNGFPFNGQIEPLKRHLSFLSEVGVDAIIIATPGVIKLAKEYAPNAAIHLSTQANVLNYLDAQIYYEMGASRIVLARETSLKDAILIKKMVPDLEIEAFCHGSMCFAYSGRCLVSAVQSGRFSNRGACANDCRFSYELYAKSPDNAALFRLSENENGTMIFNSKDLNLAAHIPEIIASGAIDSLKIEGRTKSEYYAAAATGAYRAAIDDAILGEFRAQKYADELNTLKNRGFTDGYLISRPFERTDTQNHLHSIEDGTHQVCAFSEDGEWFLCKDKLVLNEPYEILSPKNTDFATPADAAKNAAATAATAAAKNTANVSRVGTGDFAADTGDSSADTAATATAVTDTSAATNSDSAKTAAAATTQTASSDAAKTLIFKELVSPTGKAFTEIHSGNTNPVKSPIALPPFTFLRKKI